MNKCTILDTMTNVRIYLIKYLHLKNFKRWNHIARLFPFILLCNYQIIMSKISIVDRMFLYRSSTHKQHVYLVARKITNITLIKDETDFFTKNHFFLNNDDLSGVVKFRVIFDKLPSQCEYPIWNLVMKKKINSLNDFNTCIWYIPLQYMTGMFPSTPSFESALVSKVIVNIKLIFRDESF